MPRDIKYGATPVKIAARRDFIKKQKNKPRKPIKKKVDLSKIRNTRLAIRTAALKTLQIAITYKKTTTNETKHYTVCPYSYRYKKLKVGTRKMLFAYDMKEKHIKQFALVNIKSVTITTKKFTPKWDVEIK